MVFVKTIRARSLHLHDQPGKFGTFHLKEGSMCKRHSILLHWLDYDFFYAWDKNREGDEQMSPVNVVIVAAGAYAVPLLSFAKNR